MYADAVVTVILRAERDPLPQKSECSVSFIPACIKYDFKPFLKEGITIHVACDYDMYFMNRIIIQ